MHFFFVDASALAKRYAPEVGTPLIDHLMTNLPLKRLYLFNVGIAEVVSILVRKRNASSLAPAAFAQSLVDFGAEVVSAPQVEKVVADQALVTAALPLIPVHSVNSTDAIILRATIDLAAQARPLGDDFVLVTADQRLLRAAQAEGLTTFNPETQSQADLDALI